MFRVFIAVIPNGYVQTYKATGHIQCREYSLPTTGISYRSHLQGSRSLFFLGLEVGTDTLSRNVSEDLLTLEDGTDTLSRNVSEDFLTFEDGTDTLSRKSVKTS
jgi:hypothetical protein